MQFGTLMTQHEGALALTQEALERPAFDFCFCMKVGKAEGQLLIHGLASHRWLMQEMYEGG